MSIVVRTRSTVVFAPLLVALSSTPLLAHAQSSDAPAAPKLERVEVTGSSIKRIDGETALPVQILTREEIQRTGVSNAEQLLKTITATSTLGGTSVANTGAGGGQGGSGSISLISLRGLGSARTLVLVDGRRVAPAAGTSAVDISTIPLFAIERVEVLKDGASAVYGSDAIAGVVNFILRKDVKATEVSVTYGHPTRAGGGLETRVSALSGIGDLDRDRYNVSFGAGYQYTHPIFGADRSFARNINVAEKLDKTSSTAFPANVLLLSNNRIKSPNYPNCAPYSIVSPLQPGLCRYDNAPYISIEPETRLANALLNGRLAITSNTEAYVESEFSRNKTLTTEQHVLINGAALPAGNPYIASLTNLINTKYPQYPQLRRLIGSAYALLPPTSPYYPSSFAAANGIAGQPLVLLFRSVPTGVRVTEDVTDTSRVVAGVRGNAFGWDYDAGLLYSEDKLRTYLVQGWALTDPYLNLVNTGVVNPFGPTLDPAAASAAFNSNYDGLFSSTKASIESANAKATRDLFALSGGMVSVAIGAELRREKLDISPSDANAQFLISGFGAPGVPIAAARNVESAFTEVNVPILKTLEADAAVRYDHYQKVGATFNPKGSLRWQPTEQLLVRGSVGTGFRAPTLVDLYSPETRGITTNGQRDLVRCPFGTTGLVDCGTQFVTISGGNPSLKPEKSTSITYGFVFEPVKYTTIGVEAFIVRVRDTIRNGLSTATILSDPIRYASYIRRGPPDGNPSGVGPIIGIDQSLTNLGRTNVEGLDIDLSSRVLDTAANKVTLRLDGTYTTRYDVQNLNGSYTSAINQPSTTPNGLVLRWRHVASATWDAGPWQTTFAQNFQNGYTDLRTSLQPPTTPLRHVGSYETYDLQVVYAGFKSLKLTLGVKNVFDRDPPYTNYGGGFIGSYDLTYTDVRGRFGYATATYTF